MRRPNQHVFCQYLKFKRTTSVQRALESGRQPHKSVSAGGGGHRRCQRRRPVCRWGTHCCVDALWKHRGIHSTCLRCYGGGVILTWRVYLACAVASNVPLCHSNIAAMSRSLVRSQPRHRFVVYSMTTSQVILLYSTLCGLPIPIKTVTVSFKP